MKERLARIQTAAQEIGFEISQIQVEQLWVYIQQMQKWNKTYNLTALKTDEQILVQHIFDSMSIIPALRGTLKSLVLLNNPVILDVGSGGGLPGVVIAILNPTYQVICVDAVEKKVSFVRHIAGVLKLRNLMAEHTRIESRKKCQADLIISRAFASLIDFAQLAGGQLNKNHGFLLAMKGHFPNEEAEILEQETNWQVVKQETIQVPDLTAQRCLLWLQQKGE